MAVSTAAPSRARLSFWNRRRTTILTTGLVIYTLILCVGVADDVFHLGLFPTQLERQARDLIAKFADPDESARRAAAEELVRDMDSFVAVPELLRALGSDSRETRALAFECLRRMTRADLGYDPAAPPGARRAAIARWREWWRANKYRF